MKEANTAATRQIVGATMAIRASYFETITLQH